MSLLQDIRTRRFIRHVVALMLDLVLAVAAFFLAYMTTFGLEAGLQVTALDHKMFGFLLAAGIAFFVIRPYRGAWRYVSIPDLITIVKGALAAVVIYTVGSFLLTRGQNVPRSVLVLTFVYIVVGLSGVRLSYRIFVESVFKIPGVARRPRSDVRHVLLVGLSDMAESLIRASRRDPDLRYEVVGILDDAQINHGRTVQGVKVMGGLDMLPRVKARMRKGAVKLDELVVTENAPGKKRLATIIEIANANSVKVSRVPDFTTTSMLPSERAVEPRPIELGDLLDRPEVNADLEQVAKLIRGRVVLTTGAGGSIGSELCRQIASLGPSKLIMTDISEFLLFSLDTELRDKHPGLEIVPRIVDVRNAQRVARIFAKFKPEVVFHAAALKHVPMMEENPLEAVKTNVIGTRNVADSALANRAATFVMISTDKAVNPTNVMGATKRAAEAYCQALDVTSEYTRFKTVRFGNVLGSNGSVVPRFQDQIAAGGPITVTHPHIVRYFMTIPEAVRLVLHASAHALLRQGERGKIMVLDMGKPVRIIDLAQRMIQLAGFKPGVDIDIVFTGLRPGEKLYEELFDPSEVQDGRTEEGYVIAAPRIIDRHLLDRTMTEIVGAADREDPTRAMELLAHIVPEYKRAVANARIDVLDTVGSVPPRATIITPPPGTSPFNDGGRV